MSYEVDVNRAGSSRTRQEVGVVSTARAQGREGASPHYKFYELEPALVIKVDLTNADATKIGSALVRPLYSYASVPETQLPIAVPLDANTRNYPLRNEVVIVVEYNGRMYYTQRLNYFNLVNQNITIDPNSGATKDESRHNDYAATRDGNPNVQVMHSTTVHVGDYFQVNKSVQPLLPMEGDIIYEGRSGNSIRFGSSVRRGDTTLDKRFVSTWAQSNSTGAPILILRNGQSTSGDQRMSYVENINKDPASLYLTNGQMIPLNVTNANTKSWKGQAPSVFDGDQALVASDRVVLNARRREVLVFAGGSIGLSSRQSIFMDCEDQVVINSPKISLGFEAREHLLLGDKTKEWITELTNQLVNLVNAINSIFVLTGTGPSSTVQASASPAVAQLERIKQAVTQLRDKAPSLLSAQNTTL